MAKRSKKKAARETGVAKKTTAVALAKLPVWLSSDRFWALVLFGAVVLVYLPVWWAGYIWDDEMVVTANPVIIGPLGFKEIWTTVAADICPLTISTFWVEHALWGLAPVPYHIVNVVLHGISAVLLWQILRLLRIPGAWLGAALWAVNPVMVESVAWITEMKNTESGLFYLLAILFFIRDTKAGDPGARKMGWNYGLTLLFAAMAMASKSSTVILPVVLCLCAWWIEGRWQRNLIRVAPIFLMSIAAGLVSIETQKFLGADDPGMERSWPLRLAQAGDAVWFYLGKLFWPHPLMMVYPRLQIDTSDWTSYLPLVAVVVVLFVLWFKRESWLRPCFFAFACFLVALLPAVGLLNMKYFYYTIVADHFQYLAGMGPMALAGAGVAWLSALAFPRNIWALATSGAAILLLLGILSWQKTFAYQNEQTLWTDTLASNPDCWVGYNNLGMLRVHAGKIDEAMTYFQKAMEINPRYDMAENNLGGSYLNKKDFAAAVTHFRLAVEYKPSEAQYHANLGIALTDAQQFDESIVELEKALKLDPNYSDAELALGLAYIHNGRVDDAMVHFQRRLKAVPNDSAAHNNLGGAYYQKGQYADAVAQFQIAIQLDPTYEDARKNLAVAQTKLAQPAAPKSAH